MKARRNSPHRHGRSGRTPHGGQPRLGADRSDPYRRHRRAPCRDHRSRAQGGGREGPGPQGRGNSPTTSSPIRALANKEIEVNSFSTSPISRTRSQRRTGSSSRWATRSPRRWASTQRSTRALPISRRVQRSPSRTIRPMRPVSAATASRQQHHQAEGRQQRHRGLVDIVDNPKRYKFVELDAAQLPRSLPTSMRRR